VPALTVLGCRRPYKVLAVFFNLKLDTILGSLVVIFTTYMQTDEKQYMQQLKGIQSRVALLIVFLILLIL
jgi:hypothetical protein